MPETKSPIRLNGLDIAELERMLGERRLLPVDQWHPAYCGHSGMRIARDGTWYHDGTPISRPAMTRLFSTILRRDPDGSHVLVTPVEKLGIDVECTAFRAIEMESEGLGRKRRIALALDSGDALIVGRTNPLKVAQNEHGVSPRVDVRHGLEAELSRPLYYELAEIALSEGDEPPGVWSDGCFFALAAG